MNFWRKIAQWGKPPVYPPWDVRAGPEAFIGWITSQGKWSEDRPKSALDRYLEDLESRKN